MLYNFKGGAYLGINYANRGNAYSICNINTIIFFIETNIGNINNDLISNYNSIIF